MKYKCPLRIGRSNQSAVVDANGIEVARFDTSNHQLAIDLITAANVRHGRSYKLKVQEAFEVRNEERFWHTLSINIDCVNQTATLIIGRDLSTTKPFPNVIQNNMYDSYLKETFMTRGLELGVYEMRIK